MKKLQKAIIMPIFAAMFLLGGNTVAFAAVDSSVSPAPEAGASVTAEDIYPISETGNINEAPNTGIGAGPLVAAALMTGSALGIVGTIRKR